MDAFFLFHSCSLIGLFFGLGNIWFPFSYHIIFAAFAGVLGSAFTAFLPTMATFFLPKRGVCFVLCPLTG